MLRMIFLGQQKTQQRNVAGGFKTPLNQQGLESQSTSRSRKGPVPKTSPWDVAVDSFVSPLTPHPGNSNRLLRCDARDSVQMAGETQIGKKTWIYD